MSSAAADGRSAVAAVDVGGTSIKSALVDLDGRIRVHRSAPTPAAEGPDAVVAAVRAAVRELTASRDGAPVSAVGIVVPGVVDGEAGIARFSANLGWRDVPFRELVRADTGLPTVLEHDVRAAGLAEATIGRTRGVDDALVAVIGTGIAASLRCAGRTVRGATVLAGEFGHIPVFPDGEPCPCGQRGCLERYASAAAIARAYRQRTGQELTTAQLVARLGTDPAAGEVWARAVDALALAFASATMLLDPAVIVISGGLAAAGAALLEPLRDALARRVTFRPPPQVQLSTLAERAGILGAATLAARACGVTDFESWVGAIGG